ncbi:sigma-70 family RNA polymerase sigma factor [Fredinandcohnia sp. 179-A 10B2 NHS]|uniref:sigma-70 family RNA polymerase sigma factor n=1 Tax=Fredinandcohnia sp. 179-A 10B2 NHS TaxID=3235176 RepID=UPI0039A07BC8
MRNVLPDPSIHKHCTDTSTFIEDLINKYERQITNFVYTYVKDWSAAQEITQDVFIKAYEKSYTFEGRSNVKTWLFTIAANQSKDYLRALERRKKGLKYLFSNMITNVEKNTPETIFITNESNQTLAESVLALPVIYREVVILFYYEDLPTKEIGDLLQMSSSTVRTRLNRARQMLKSLDEGSEINE